MSGKTSTKSKRQYNQKAYKTHLYTYRRNSDLGECIQEFKTRKGTSLNYLITSLLANHFSVAIPTPETDIDK